MRVSALALRILNQIRHDKRTLGLILIAPLLILTVVYYIFNSGDSQYSVGLVNPPTGLEEVLTDTENVDLIVLEMKAEEARESVENEEVMAVLDFSEETPRVYLDASDATKASQLMGILHTSVLLDNASGISEALSSLIDSIPPGVIPGFEPPELPDPGSGDWEVDYVYGNEDSTFFDNFGAPMVGIIVFFLTFLIAGINFLGERTTGTLEKLLSTPIRRGEIIAGYTLGFGILAVIQSTLVTLFVVYVLHMQLAGSIWFVMLINLLTAVAALTLGILLSTLAGSEFQMVQFIPIVILPQIFLCGLFDLTGGWQVAGYFMPLYYTTDALQEIMLKGHGFDYFYLDALVLAGLSLLFVLLNGLLLRRHRGI